MPVLVTGASGQVGGGTVRRLVEANVPTRALSRDPASANLPAGVEAWQGDLSDPSTVVEALAGVDRVFLMAPSASVAPYTRLFCPVAKDAGVRHVVLLSSSAVELAGDGHLSAEHRDAEEAVLASELRYTFLRPGAFASNTFMWAASIRADGRVRNPFGSAPTAPIDPDDIAAVAFEALTSDDHIGRSYLLTGPERLTPAEQTDILAEALGRSLTFEELPETEAVDFFASRGVDPDQAAEMVSELRRHDLPWRDPTPAVEDVTGRRAVTFADWASQNVAAFS